MARFGPYRTHVDGVEVARFVPGSERLTDTQISIRVEFGPFTRRGRFWRWLTAPLRRRGWMQPSVWDRAREAALRNGGVSVGYTVENR